MLVQLKKCMHGRGVQYGDFPHIWPAPMGLFFELQQPKDHIFNEDL